MFFSNYFLGNNVNNVVDYWWHMRKLSNMLTSKEWKSIMKWTEEEPRPSLSILLQCYLSLSSAAKLLQTSATDRTRSLVGGKVKKLLRKWCVVEQIVCEGCKQVQTSSARCRVSQQLSISHCLIELKKLLLFVKKYFSVLP